MPTNLSTNRTEPSAAVIELPWYRYTWPWVLISLPFAAVLFGILMMYMVTRYPDDLIVDNYYKEGMAINQSLAMDAAAQALNVEASLLKLEPGQIQFAIRGVTDSVVVLELFHVVDHERDQKWILYPDPGVADSRTVIYSSHDKDIEVLISGQGIWYLQLSGADDHWRLRKRITTPIQQLVLHSQ
ncbi:FixH family protein [Pseudomonadales bacterium]|nr:FixH family protein [Pseudomonadales bacterium]